MPACARGWRCGEANAIDDTMSREQAAEWLEGQVRGGGGAFFP